MRSRERLEAEVQISRGLRGVGVESESDASSDSEASEASEGGVVGGVGGVVGGVGGVVVVVVVLNSPLASLLRLFLRLRRLFLFRRRRFLRDPPLLPLLLLEVIVLLEVVRGAFAFRLVRPAAALVPVPKRARPEVGIENIFAKRPSIFVLLVAAGSSWTADRCAGS